MVADNGPRRASAQKRSVTNGETSSKPSTPSSTLHKFFQRKGADSSSPTPERTVVEGTLHVASESSTQESGLDQDRASEAKTAKKRKEPNELNEIPRPSGTVREAVSPTQIDQETSTILATEHSSRKKQKLQHEHGKEGDTAPFPVDISKGKVVFLEKKMNFSRHPSTVSELAAFFEFKQEQSSAALDEIPSQFRGLLAKLIEESPLELQMLAESVREALCPPSFDDQEEDEDFIRSESIQAGIQAIAERQNYGIQWRGSTCPKLAVWRWEVQDLSLFTSEMADHIRQRRAKRRQAARILHDIFEKLSVEEQTKLLPGDCSPRNDQKRVEAEARNAARLAEKDAKLKLKEQRAAEKAAEKAERERKAAEKAAEKVEKERIAAEKKAEKERKVAEKKAEKEKLEAEKQAAREAEEAAKAKQLSIAGFFSRRKKDETKEELPVPVKSETQTFWEHFPPFHKKERVFHAPYNRFWRELPPDIVDTLFKDEEVSLPCFPRIINGTAQQSEGKPTDAMDIDKDDTLSTLGKVKWKLLQFHENFRPAYWGTWSKKSTRVTGRRPFAKDIDLLEYDYDSEAEWEEEEPGEELRSDDEDEEDGSEVGDADEDEDNWLVPHGYLSDDEGVEKDAEDEVEAIKRAQQIVPTSKRAKERPKWGVLAALVPDIKGPHLVNAYEVDDTTHPLSQYRAQSLLDICVNIDPFESGAMKEDPQTVLDNGTVKDTTVRKTPGSKKAAFPEERISELIQMISGRTEGISKLVDEIKSRCPEVSKAQIEAKIREVAVREKQGNDQKPRWHIRDGTRSVASLPGTASRVAPSSPGSILGYLSPKASRPETPIGTPSRRAAAENLQESPLKRLLSTPVRKIMKADDRVSVVIPSPDIVSCKPEEFATIVTTLETSATTTPDTCVNLLTTSKAITYRVYDMPVELVSTLLQVAGNSETTGSLRSKCLRVLGNYVSVLEQHLRKDGSVSQMEENRKRWKSVLDQPEIFNCMDRNLVVSEENGATSLVVKNALRLLVFLVQSTDPMIRPLVDDLRRQIAQRWMSQLVNMLEDSPVEVVGYCVALIDSAVDIYEGFNGSKQWELIERLLPYFRKLELYRGPDGVLRDKYMGVKKYALRILVAFMTREEWKLANTPYSHSQAIIDALTDMKVANENQILFRAVDECLTLVGATESHSLPMEIDGEE
ncbi:uncharacterized protein SPPG_07105 [Spizellomyces punctatus DAOM BR117]|uniref:Chromatin assembly factor 1 subunit A n=1 Tax=Spizellomyces punctatus (strain DAOM BR117) TaxID=645134 RepID=A0A0L0H9F3_SPIPD|nr:uncharacterized protein SPPG_07105 [Spizellomyces punctatus DAOM BR117]KNC97636.1 hypothetical protein SPPG_07105 [Spizellomyces punctatus DAOM BR117]|eukprot:XP_016605676.1 hypothetical protein SPPG_07105 [Spizellomyces punctatus DAOM BR117]